MDYEDDNDYVDFSEQGDSSDFQVDHDDQGWAEQPPEEFDIYGGEGSSTEMSDEELMASAMASVPTMQVLPEEHDQLIAEVEYKRRTNKVPKIGDLRAIPKGADYDTDKFQGMKESDIFLSKIGNMSYNIQAAFRDVALGKALSDQAGIDGQSMQVAMSEFTNITGVSGKEFASRIKLDSSVQATRSTQDLRTVNSMLANVATDLEMGPGAKLTGNIHGSDIVKQEKLADDQAWAYSIMDELVEMTKEGIRGQKGEAAYTARVSNSIYDAAMNSAVGPDSLNWVPLPSELGVYGTVLNMAASSGPMGTKYNRTTFSDAFPHLLTEHGEMGQIMGGDGVMIDSGIVPHTRGMRSDLLAEMQNNIGTGNRNSDELNDYLRNSPSLKATYMPKPSDYSKMSLDGQQSWRDERDAAWETFEANLIRARGILGRQTVTTRDESNGNNIRLSGFDRPYDEQADRMSAINEANIYGIGDGEITQGQSVDLESLRRATTGGGIEKVHQKLIEDNNKLGTSAGVGTETGGMYGETPMTEMDQFIELSGEGLSSSEVMHYLETGEKPEDIPTIYANTDRGRYQKWVDTTNPPEQGSDAWLAQRKGNVTASAVDKLNGGKGETRVIQNLALEGMGLPAIGGFKGNATSQRGNDMEGTAKNQFLTHMAKAGTPLDWEEAYFETNPELPGMGVSPDGRLYNEDGSSAGLLEIKVLKHEYLAGALNKYYKQMQMQMAVTGEKSTHFWAMDAEGSGDHVEEIVYADEDMQKELIKKANNAQSIASSLSTIEDVEAYRMARIRSKSVRMNKPSHTQGQQTGWVEKPTEVVVPAAWTEDWQEEVGLASGGDKVTSKNSVMAAAAAKIAKAEAREGVLDAEELLLNAEGKTSARQDNASAAASKEEKAKELALAKEAMAARQQEIDAIRATAQEVSNFKQGIGTMMNVLGEVGGFVGSGTDSFITDDVASRMAGAQGDRGRGIRDILEEKGNLSKQQSARVLANAGKQTAEMAMNPEAAIKGLVTRFTYATSQDNASDEMKALKQLDIPAWMAADSQGRIAMQQDLINQVSSAKDKAILGNVVQNLELAATNDVTGGMIAVARDITQAERKAKAIETDSGQKEAANKIRDLNESGSQVGETFGYASKWLETASSVANTTSGKMLSGGVAALLAGKGLAALGGGTVAATAKAAVMKAGVKTPLTLAATAIPMATRYGLDVKDDGSLADSALDIADWASWGGAAGGLVGGLPGAAIGAAAGVGLGIGNEMWEHTFGNANGLTPDNTITTPKTSDGKPVVVENTNNVVTNVSVSEDMVTTETDANGEDFNEMIGLGI
jgi:hypothetical protein